MGCGVTGVKGPKYHVLETPSLLEPHMSTEPYTYIEQDPIIPPAGNELPTYDDLAQQNGPNSRYLLVQRPIISSRSAEHLIDSADGKDGLRKGIYIHFEAF